MKRLITALATTIIMTGVAFAEVTAVYPTKGAGSWVIKDGDLYLCGLLKSEEKRLSCMRVSQWMDCPVGEEVCYEVADSN